jgi:integrase
MVRVRLKYVIADVDRHGNVRYYFRRRGRKGKLRLPGLPGSDEFNAAHAAALAGRPPPVKITQPLLERAPLGTLEWLRKSYFSSIEFGGLSSYTQRDRRNILKAICAETLSPHDPTRIGDLPFVQMSEKSVRMLRNRKKDAPNAANNWVSALSTLFKWAIEENLAEVNPARDVPKIGISTEGYHTWATEEIKQYEAVHQIGTQARLALALLAYTGLRRSDVIRIGPQHVDADGALVLKPQKTKKTNVTVHVPILPELQKVILATRCGHLTYLTSEWDRPWSAAGFSSRFKQWCKEAKLGHCSAHGLRKAGACLAAENGATEQQMMAIFGWKTASMASKYTRAANRKKIAGASIHLLSKRRNET